MKDHQCPASSQLGQTGLRSRGIAIAGHRNHSWSTAKFGGLYRFLLNKWYWDELYDFLFVRPAFALGRIFWKRGDQGLIDRFGPNGFAELVVEGNKLAARFQSGYLASYALVMLIGLAAAATWAITQ